MASWKSTSPLHTPSNQTPAIESQKVRTWMPYSKFNTPQLLQLAYTKRTEIIEFGGSNGDQLRRELLNVNLIESLRDRMLAERMIRKRTSGGNSQTTLKKQKSIFLDENDEEAITM